MDRYIHRRRNRGGGHGGHGPPNHPTGYWPESPRYGLSLYQQILQQRHRPIKLSQHKKFHKETAKESTLLGLVSVTARSTGRKPLASLSHSLVDAKWAWLEQKCGRGQKFMCALRAGIVWPP